ncbi:MAG: chromosomal replication initiator protein DnaA [Bacilli bacterium]|nr:chromosomal replication initiator protein DnaA [Bacilli bacterium]
MPETISELNRIWSRVLEELQVKIDDSHYFSAFLDKSHIHSFDDNAMVVAVNSMLAVNFLSKNYQTFIQNAVKEITGRNVKVTFDVADNLKSAPKTVFEENKYFKYSIVNESLSFENFIAGPCNIEAKQAALLIAKNPGYRDYNPLFIYSDSGLGKTHLLSAIANYTRESASGKRALYCTGTDFLEEYMLVAGGEKEFNQLKEYIVSYDILIIDDVQMIGGKEKTTDFLFQVFQKMYTLGKQVVISSDKHPSELKGFDERLKSRFAGGLSISIASPDVETCVSIIKSKINAGPLDINAFDQDVLEFIGSKFSKNIRNIDEALNKLVFYTTAFKPTKHIDMAIAMEALQPLVDVRVEKQKLNEQRIIAIVADYYSLTPAQIVGNSRESNIALARHVSMYLIRALLDVPFTKIGMTFGGKDHSTVMNGVQKVEKELKINTNLQEAINELKKRLK